MGNFDINQQGFSVDQNKLYELLLKRKGVNIPETQILISKEDSNKCSLSLAQKKFWFLHQVDSEGSAYNVPVVFSITGSLNITGLEESFNNVIQRHAALRTIFVMEKDEPVQVIQPKSTINLRVIDIGQPEHQETGIQLQQRIMQEIKQPFSLSEGPLIRAVVYRLSDKEHILAVTIHHIVFDGWSLKVFIKEIMEYYKSIAEDSIPFLPELSVQYADFARWQYKWLEGDEFKNNLAYWKTQLANVPPIITLSTDRPRPAIQTSSGAIQRFELEKILAQSLKKLSQQADVSLFTTLLAGFSILISRYTSQEDIVIGSPFAERTNPQIKDLIGCFINTLVLRIDLSGNPSFFEILNKVKRTVLEAFNHAGMPFERLAEELHIKRDLSYSPLFQVMFAMRQTAIPEVSLPGLNVSYMDIYSGNSQCDLSMDLWEEAEVFKGTLEYNPDLFDPSRIQRMVEHYRVLLKDIVENPTQKISDIKILPKAESDQLLTEWNNTKTDYQRNACVHELFEEQVKRTPQAYAIMFENKHLSYSELNSKANQLAHFLMGVGVGPEVRVGICIEYSLDLLVAVLGVLKAGGGYVPLDTEYPAERLAFILNDAESPVLLTQKSIMNKFSDYKGRIICLDTDWDTITSGLNSENATNKAVPENMACIIYTSGSTGLPKGVLIEHRNLINLISSFIQSYHPDTKDRILPITSTASASFVGEILPIICAGGSIVLLKKNEILDFEDLESNISKYGISIISTVPSVISRLNQISSKVKGLRLILSGGEALFPSDVTNLLESVTIVNGYGLTETTICSTYFILNRNNTINNTSIPIGKPIMNTQIYILDKNLDVMPIGYPGEIFISGDGLARGYVNRPEFTAERFLDSPFQHGKRIYRTGDMGRWLPDGNIEFLGRADQQVKIRGFRVELNEIEARLSQHPGIREVAVTFSDDIENQKRLIAYIVANDPRQITDFDLREWLHERVPDYMMPSDFLEVDEIPYLPNGKVDYRFLSGLAKAKLKSSSTYEAPSNDTEILIAGIWQEALHSNNFGVNDNFFDLGGHSLLIAQVQSKLKGMVNKKLSIIDMFKYPTIKSLANYIDDNRNEPHPYPQIFEKVRKQKEAFSKLKQIRGTNK